MHHQGRYYRIDGVTIEPKPIRKPRPPILLGADTVPTVARVPGVADHWIASRRHTKTFLREAVPAYKRALEQQGRPFKGLYIFRDLCIADSRKEAEDRIREGYERRYERHQRWGQPGERYDLPFEQLQQDRLGSRQPGGGERAGPVLPRGVRRRDDVVHGSTGPVWTPESPLKPSSASARRSYPS